MKILYLIPYTPVNPTFGGALRIYHILDHLCANHDVTVAGFSTPEEEQLLVQRFPELAGKTYFVKLRKSDSNRYWPILKSLFTRHSLWYTLTRSEKLQQKLDQLLEEQSFQIIQSEFPVMGMYRLNSSALKIMDAHNVEYDNFHRMTKVKNIFKKLFYYIESRKFKREEIGVCREQDALFATSERDISIFDESVENVPKYLIPNGVDTDYFHPFETTPKPYSMVFVGMMKYVPNYDGINWFLDEIFPKILDIHPEATITIIGKNPPASIARRAGKNIIVTGFVDDTRPYIQESAVYVVPLRMGGGTRLKIIESLAMKKPIVSTSIGCEGIDVSNGKNILIADEPQAFADSVIELFSNQDLSSRLTENGYDLVMDQYRWQSIGKHIDRAYHKLAEKKTKLKESDLDRRAEENHSVYPVISNKELS